MVESILTENKPSAALPGVQPSAPAKRSSLFANRNLGLLWFGESISLIGDQFYMVALPWLVLQLTGSALAVGAILAVAGIPRAVLMLLGGVFTDRMSPRLLMLLSNAARIVITGLLTALVVTHTIQVWTLYALSFAFGVVDAFFQPASMAIVPMLVEDADLAAGNAAIQGTSLLVSGVGPGIGGVLVKLAGTGFSFFLDTLSFAVATVSLLFMDPARIKQAPARKAGILAEIREAFVYIRADSLLRPMMLIILALNFLFAGPMMVGPSVLARQRFFEQGSIALGILLSAMGIGSLVGMLAGSMFKPARLGLVTLSFFALAGLGIAGAGFFSTLGLSAALFALVGTSYGFSNLLIITWLQQRISKEMMGRVMSIVMLSSLGMMPISSALGGLLASYSLTLLFALNGGLLVLLVIVSLFNTAIRGMRA
jgi:MFS family permease